MTRFPPAAALLLFALAGCGAEPPQTDLDGLDRELTQPAADPAVRAALADPIMVDPALAQGANGNAIRPPARPDPYTVPPVDIARLPDLPAGDPRAPRAAGECPECRAAEGAFTPAALAARQPARAIGLCGHVALFRRLGDAAAARAAAAARCARAGGGGDGRGTMPVARGQRRQRRGRRAGDRLVSCARATGRLLRAAQGGRRAPCAGRHARGERLCRLCRPARGRWQQRRSAHRREARPALTCYVSDS